MNKIFTILILLIFIGCKNHQEHVAGKIETPVALQDENTTGSYLSKSRNDDILEGLYKEMVAKTPKLNDIESAIAHIDETRDDSMASFDNYDKKIQSYFNSASEHFERIKDSSLKAKMKILIAANLATYNLGIAPHSKLLTEINSGVSTLSDLHTVLKITATLPMIIKYGKENLPSTLPLEGFKKETDKAIRLTDNFIKKGN